MPFDTSFSLSSCSFGGVLDGEMNIDPVSWEWFGTGSYGCFLKWWYPQIIHFNRVFHYKPSILGYHHFRKPPLNQLWNGFSQDKNFYATFTFDLLLMDGSEVRPNHQLRLKVGSFFSHSSQGFYASQMVVSDFFHQQTFPYVFLAFCWSQSPGWPAIFFLPGKSAELQMRKMSKSKQTSLTTSAGRSSGRQTA